MENASKALIIAGGILLGVLILTLMATLFLSAKELSASYEQRKLSEAVQQFNVNFTKYIGQNLSIHQVITITNFAHENGVTVNGGQSISNITEDTLAKIYKLIIPPDAYDANGYITQVQITN